MIPQAFTTRDMSEAYKWLQTLPSTVREEMKSMEQVVSLYLKAKRLGSVPSFEEGNAKTSPPSKSSQDFQKTLKNLQHELEQFDFQDGPVAQPQVTLPTPPSVAHGGFHPPTPPSPQTHYSSHPSAAQHHHASPPHTPSHTQPPQHAHQTPSHAPAPSQANVEHPPVIHQNILSALRLDPKSRQIINEIRESLNLSSDLEVIRLSLVIAHRDLQALLK